jgi:hypothetical protein
MRALMFALAIAGIAVAVPAAAQDAKQDFRLVNRTGYELKEVYVAPSKSDSWEEDILGTGTLEEGKAVNIHFSPKVQTCKWDLKVVYTVDDSNAVWSNINLCDVDKITIFYDKKNDVTRASFD